MRQIMDDEKTPSVLGGTSRSGTLEATGDKCACFYSKVEKGCSENETSTLRSFSSVLSRLAHEKEMTVLLHFVLNTRRVLCNR